MSSHDDGLMHRVPWGVIAAALIIPFIGIVNLYSAGQFSRPNLYLLQAAYLGVSLVVATFVVRMSTSTLEVIAIPAWVVTIGLLMAVLVVGTTVKGATRWLNLGFFNLQPSELAKLTTILITARIFSHYSEPGGYTLRDLLRPWNLTRPIGALVFLFFRWHKQEDKLEKAVAKGIEVLPSIDGDGLKVAAVVVIVIWALLCLLDWRLEEYDFKKIVAPVDPIFLSFGLVLIEPDLGTSLIVISIAGVQILFAGVKKGSMAIAFAALSSIAVFGWQFLLKPYQKQRVLTFLNPESDAQGAGYHAIQSKIAVGSGGTFGKGFLEGTQTQLSFLPENHTDFAFSVWAEEWGFVGGTFLIFSFALLLGLLLYNLRFCTEKFAVLVGVGGCAMIFCHLVINISMVTGLMPVVGMTLPFVSYGGSSMVTQVLAVALAVNAITWRRA
ncbi:MAG: rod shape-determining protein RodA [Deltaproteobacteria bacterium]|nr:rod shape-determining protein RodA [Deltaproteobacteria bacterium]